MWTKPVGISRYHIFPEFKYDTLCGKSFALDGREKIEEAPPVDRRCEECVRLKTEVD
jgi:hypothetical protein